MPKRPCDEHTSYAEKCWLEASKQESRLKTALRTGEMVAPYLELPVPSSYNGIKRSVADYGCNDSYSANMPAQNKPWASSSVSIAIPEVCQSYKSSLRFTGPKCRPLTKPLKLGVTSVQVHEGLRGMARKSRRNENNPNRSCSKVQVKGSSIGESFGHLFAQGAVREDLES